MIKKNEIEKLSDKRGHYILKPILQKMFLYELNNKPDESSIWTLDIKPLLPQDIKDNVLIICNYGFTEIFNNAIDHSSSGSIAVQLKYDIAKIGFTITDCGVGIFNKIQKDFNLADPHESILELAKGKLTSDPEKHSGEGIFFTSRAFDEFYIISRGLSFLSPGDKDIIIDTNDININGTGVTMSIYKNSNKSLSEIFSLYTTDEGYGFTKTILPVKLLQYEGEALMSRSQAKRLIVRFEKFKEVILDFEGIKIIGQGFADELFRIFQREHPRVKLKWINTARDVENMIFHVTRV
jgi:hypothetical protein